MLCPLVPCSSRANETPVSIPVSNGQPMCFSWVYHYCDYSCQVRGVVIVFFNYFWVALYWYLFLFGAFVVFVHISQLLVWFMPLLLLLELCSPFSLQVLLVVIWFMTIRFLYVLVGTVHLKVGLICHFLCNPKNLVHFFCLLCFVFCHLIIVLVWCHPLYFCLMGCFCLHRAFLVTHVQDWLKKKFTITLFFTIVDKHLSIFQF